MFGDKTKAYSKYLMGISMGFAWLFTGVVLWANRNTLTDNKIFLLATPIVLSVSLISFYTYKSVQLYRSRHKK
ncbi:hypothetical protein [Candidatus Epulonipiscium viviparus]|uniref:hypothetical protein n=1 Tax=Candidatus Epulonipiscium viviparus TaxID=420336 RepID=UPI0027380C80|nr:hypothetical protein [Candidatus Epulopiscium viviparus]